jgi:Flp pilus assembly secretin CpaC
VVINAVAAGEGDIILWLQSGRRVHYRVQVHTAADRMQVSIAVKFAEVASRHVPASSACPACTATRTCASGAANFCNDALIDPITGKITVPSATRYLTVLTDFGTDDLLAFLDAQEQSGNAHLLAEPTIITANREWRRSSPAVRSPFRSSRARRAHRAAVSIQFKEYGVRLRSHRRS